MALASCGSDDADKQVKRAEAQVAHQQRELDDARETFTTASASFCQSSRAYIVALDRYGDLLHATAPTVGDVKDAGKDLADPGEEAGQSAQDAVEAHDHVVQAERDLAEAQAALERARGGSTSASPSGEASATAGTSSPTPLVPAATVTQVKTAESDYDTAMRGITDQTPLAQASQEFNSATVALEVAWTRLVTDAGCLTEDEQQQAESVVHAATKSIQTSLAQAGYYDGPSDGVYGPATVAAVEALQRAHDLPVTGAVDKATSAALQADLQQAGGAAAQEAAAGTAAVQQTLRLAGYWDGPVDGTWTPELTDAVKELQKDLGVAPTGAVDAATLAALEAAIATAKQAGSANVPGSPTAAGSVPTTAAPSSTTPGGTG
ncbi:peptidoglycan-binding domain-containing protein [Nocardioides sp. Iso805N]|uniref:peptidoglycan-binding domain-containing protein n=1 Tax=Nocardioides sp. Iso805N TaxID=1283287 RepID=UPI00037508BB|nr:peptidoglycan-binding protein [Nocardioides sp. Iso805N]